MADERLLRLNKKRPSIKLGQVQQGGMMVTRHLAVTVEN